MRPLTSGDVSASFLETRPFLLLKLSAFELRHVGFLLLKDNIRSQNGKTLPPEIWLMIFGFLKDQVTDDLEDQDNSYDYCLARPLKAMIGKGGCTTLTCRVDPSALNFRVARLRTSEEVLELEDYLARPDAGQGKVLSLARKMHTLLPRQTHKSSFFYVTMTDDNEKNHFSANFEDILLADCLFYDLTVPDIIAYLQDQVCIGCDGEHIIYPDYTSFFDYFDESVDYGYHYESNCRGFFLACPLCLGLDMMEEDKALLQTYRRKPMPKGVLESRKKRIAERLEGLGYRLDVVEDDALN